MLNSKYKVAFSHTINKADLHVHSKYSDDGEFGIQEIADRCICNKIGILSITDHNIVKANKEATAACRKAGIDFIPGIEIDCCYNGTDLHLLGYNIDWKSEDFKDLEKSFFKKAMDSFPEMIEKLDKCGIKVSATAVLEKTEGGLPNAELIAEVLLADKQYLSNRKLWPYMSGGERSDMPLINFYLDFFTQGKPAYVKINNMDFSDAIELVKSNGGTPVVAHPGMNLRGKEEMINELLDNGAMGFEVFNNYHDANQIDFFADLAYRRRVIMTCGSDFHGKNKPLIDIGSYRINNRYEDYLHESIMKINR